MTTLTITYRCRHCTSPDLTTLTTGKPTQHQQSAILRCNHCGHQTQLLIRSIPLDEPTQETPETTRRRIAGRYTPPGPPCDPPHRGTIAGYARHLSANTIPCADCRAAKATYERERKHR